MPDQLTVQQAPLAPMAAQAEMVVRAQTVPLPPHNLEQEPQAQQVILLILNYLPLAAAATAALADHLARLPMARTEFPQCQHFLETMLATARMETME